MQPEAAKAVEGWLQGADEKGELANYHRCRNWGAGGHWGPIFWVADTNVVPVPPSV